MCGETGHTTNTQGVWGFAPEYIYVMHHTTQQPTILLVDDAPESLSMLSAILQNEGYKVRAAINGTMALQTIKKALPDMILLDISMPDMSGYEVCCQIKESPSSHHIPVLFISAMDEVMDKVKAFSVGGVDYITKPFHVEEVLARVKTQLAIHQAHDELERRVQERTAELVLMNTTLQEEISERKQAQSEREIAFQRLEETNNRLLRSRNVLRAIFDNLHDGLMLVDSQGYVQAANKALAHLFGTKPEHLVGKHWPTYYTSHAPDFPGDIILRPPSTSNQHQRIHYPSSDNSTRILDINVITLLEQDDNRQEAIEQSILHIVDMTEHVHLQARVIENERLAASGKLAASVAHEINTPLQSLEFSLQMIQIASPEERTRFLAEAAEEIQRVGRIVHQLLDMYRPGVTAYGPVNINALFERVLLLIGKWIRDQGVTIERNLVQHIPTIWGRTDELNQVFINLMMNALQSMPDGGTIYIRTKISDNAICQHATETQQTTKQVATHHVIIEVSDTGYGISPELQTRIFEPFVTTREDGTGLGLAITQRIVHDHGGTITVTSQPGNGSTFTVTLPVQKE